LWLAEEASLSALRGALAANPDVVHLLAHGVDDVLRERGASILLAPSKGDDGILGCAEAETLLSARLVVLSSCRAGSGPQRLGDDGAEHLGGACFVAGADCVILSPAALDFDATLAAREAVYSESRWRAPYFWALMQAVGSGCS
jgi:CHAT domain-containing protein